SDEFDREEHPELLNQPLAASETPPELDDEMNRLRDEEAAGNDVQEWDESETADGDFLAEEPAEPAQEEEINWSPTGVELPRRPLGWNGKPQKRGLVKPDEVRQAFSPHERLLILDTWQRSGLPAGDFAPLVGLSKHTLYLWKKR